jgi:hypothetical protein
MEREASETHALVKNNADEGEGGEQTAEMEREASETHALVKSNADK